MYCVFSDKWLRRMAAGVIVPMLVTSTSLFSALAIEYDAEDGTVHVESSDDGETRSWQDNHEKYNGSDDDHKYNHTEEKDDEVVIKSDSDTAGHVEVEAGDYSDADGQGNNLTIDAQTDTKVDLGKDGEETQYDELNIKADQSDVTIDYSGDVTMNGENNANSTTNAIDVVGDASVTIQGNPENGGDNSLTIDGYNSGVMTKGEGDAEIKIGAGDVTIQNSQGEQGSGIFLNNTGDVTINIGESDDDDDDDDDDNDRTTEASARDRVYDTKFTSTNNKASGIYAYNHDGAVDLNIENSEVHLDENGFSGYYASAESNNIGTTATIADSLVSFDGNGTGDSGTGFAYSNASQAATFDVSDSYVSMSGNATQGINGGMQSYQNSTIDANGNGQSNIQAYSVDAANAAISANEAKVGYGIWCYSTENAADQARFRLVNSDVSANGNARDGVYVSPLKGCTSFWTVMIDHSTVEASGNKFGGMFFNSAATITNGSSLSAKGNGKTGLWLRSIADAQGKTDSLIQDSKLETAENGRDFQAGAKIHQYAGMSTTGNIDILNSVVNLVGEKWAYAFEGTNQGATTIHGSSVVALNGSDKDIYGGAANQQFIVLSGSVQADWAKMSMDALFTGEDGKAVTIEDYLGGKGFNLIKDQDQIYVAPINADGTTLTRFDLSEEIAKGGDLTRVNDETGAFQCWQFTYYDPESKQEYQYQFRYNADGEDLADGVHGKVYVWVPVSVVKYNTTQGQMNGENPGTAAWIDDKHAADFTIYGNSLALAEKTIAGDALKTDEVADSDVFQGWFISTAEGVVQSLEAYLKDTMTQEAWDALYAQLNGDFTQASKVIGVLGQLNTGLEEITIFAKWGEPEPTPTPEPGPNPRPNPNPDPDPDDDDDEPTVIPEDDTPRGDTPEETGEIPNVDVPLSETPEEITEIPNASVPLAETPEDTTPAAPDAPHDDVPKTGDESSPIGLLMASLLSAMAAAVSFGFGKKRRD